MAARRGGVRSLQRFAEIKKLLQRIPKPLQQEAARRFAEKMTYLMLRAYDSGRQVDGSPRPLGVRGNKLTLVKTGETRRGIRFVASGNRIIFIAAGAAQYLGEYGIVPDAFELPIGWQRHLQIIASEVLRGLVTK